VTPSERRRAGHELGPPRNKLRGGQLSVESRQGVKEQIEFGADLRSGNHLYL
jgi:hypothetical protein